MLPQEQPSITTPVVFILFNRPQKTAETFAQIAKMKPASLYLVADGPRPNHPTDKLNCAAARAVVEQIDWECTVQRNYAEQNMGCKRRVASGLDWVFAQVEEAIILEDDILMDSSFFAFAQEMLETYRHDTRIRHIAGYNSVSSLPPSLYSYFFSRWAPIWGWATWRRAWQSYDVAMSLWSPQVRNMLYKQGVVPPAKVREFEMTYQGKIDTWDYQWQFSQLMQSGLSIIPEKNLIRNIGFGADATHTFDRKSSHAHATTQALSFPLIHPPYIMANPAYDQALYARSHVSLPARIRGKMGGLLQKMTKRAL